tara:strand:- start:380 stop:610 length:231 start_codon:yes stop_codon:yes gene_type:complete
MPSPKNIAELRMRLKNFLQFFVLAIYVLGFMFFALVELCWLFNYILLLEPFIYYSAAIVATAVALVYAWSQSFQDL